MKTVFVGLVFFLVTGKLVAQDFSNYTPVSNGVSYKQIAAYDTSRLNNILTKELKDFSNFNITYPRARYKVKVYKIVYPSIIPEQGNRPTFATGLIAIPEIIADSMPVVSYQHGHTFNKKEAPSYIEQSYETRSMIAQFASQGYVVIAPDYFGKGDSPEKNSFLIKQSTQQACVDMLFSADAVLKSMKISRSQLFISGWSQGAWSSMVFLNKLESLGIKVTAAATASTGFDFYAVLSSWVNPPPTAAADPLLPSKLAVLLNSMQEYNQLPGLTQWAIKPAYQKVSLDFYTNAIGWPEFRDHTPIKLSDYLSESFIQSSVLGEGAFWKIAREGQAYQWKRATPLRSYYGQLDNVTSAYVAKLPIGYQQLIGGAEVQAIDAGPLADHLGTFLFGAKNQKTWFDSLLSKKSK